jgi:hypothetical protein
MRLRPPHCRFVAFSASLRGKNPVENLQSTN